MPGYKYFAALQLCYKRQSRAIFIENLSTTEKQAPEERNIIQHRIGNSIRGFLKKVYRTPIIWDLGFGAWLDGPLTQWYPQRTSSVKSLASFDRSLVDSRHPTVVILLNKKSIIKQRISAIEY